MLTFTKICIPHWFRLIYAILSRFDQFQQLFSRYLAMISIWYLRKGWTQGKTNDRYKLMKLRWIYGNCLSLFCLGRVKMINSQTQYHYCCGLKITETWHEIMEMVMRTITTRLVIVRFWLQEQRMHWCGWTVT